MRAAEAASRCNVNGELLNALHHGLPLAPHLYRVANSYAKLFVGLISAVDDPALCWNARAYAFCCIIYRAAQEDNSELVNAVDLRGGVVPH